MTNELDEAIASHIVRTGEVPASITVSRDAFAVAFLRDELKLFASGSSRIYSYKDVVVCPEKPEEK